MSDLPQGWTTAAVGEFASLLSGPAFRSEHFVQEGLGVRLLRGDNIEPGSLRWRDVRCWPKDRLAGTEHLTLEVHDVILAMDRPVISSGLKIAQVAAADLPALLVQRVARLRCGVEMNSQFLYLALQHPDFQRHLTGGQTGTQLPHVSLKHIGAYVMPIPPLAEQERIVAAIEEAFSKLGAGEAGLRTVRQHLKRMRDAILSAAVTGCLVPQDPTDTPATKLLADLGVSAAKAHGALPDGWAAVRLGDVARVGSGATPKRGHAGYWEDGSIPWVTSGLITKGVIREAREFVTDRALAETALRVWPRGTLLVAMYGEGQTRGRCAELGFDATCNQACAAIVLSDPFGTYQDFVRLVFDANYTANRRLASGGVQPNLNAGLIKEMVIQLAPPEEQARIVAEVERQLSFIEACERAVNTGLARSAALRRSVLKAAFEGRLVPQDPSDEPAWALLDRVRAERAATATLPKRRHTPSLRLPS